MDLKKVENKQLLFDGMNDEFYTRHSYKLRNGDEVNFTIQETKSLTDLDKEGQTTLRDEILKSIPTIKRFAPEPEFIYYKNENGLSVSLLETNKYLVVIASGEIQPGRYIIFIESIFLLPSLG
jgi:hypothetical protein